jgi:PleD family two-component response regulator
VVTISGGLAQLQPSENPEAFLKRADDLLYEAKESGRNSILQSATESAPEQP